MALSETRKKNIIADFKTGAFSLNKLAKKHKISTNTVKKICTDINHDNAPLVRALYDVENLKNCTKNAQEIKAVENVVKNRLKVEDLSSKLLDKVGIYMEKNKAQKVVSSKMGFDVVETDLQSNDYKNLADTIDKASITLGVNDRFSSSQVQVNNQQNNNITLEIE